MTTWLLGAGVLRITLAGGAKFGSLTCLMINSSSSRRGTGRIKINKVPG
jgi:hypothetical protein